MSATAMRRRHGDIVKYRKIAPRASAGGRCEYLFPRGEPRNPRNENNDVDFARASRRPSIIDWLLFKPQLDAINTSLEVSRCDREQCCTR